MKNCKFHNTLTVRTLIRVFMGRRGFFGCDMNTWEPKIHEKLQISQHIDRQDLATSVHGEHDDEHEDEHLVADFGVRLRRAQSSPSVERSAAPCLCGEIPLRALC